MRVRAPIGTAIIAALAAACHRTPAPQQLSADVSQIAPRVIAEEAMHGSRGDTAQFGVKIVDVSYAPDRATYELRRPSYVTVVSITQDRVTAITPSVGRSGLAGSGSHTLGLDEESRRSLDNLRANYRIGRVTPDDASAAQIMEYNRCLSRARAVSAARRSGRRPIIGRDSTGNPIYGQAPLLDSPDDIDYEARCRIPTSPGKGENDRTTRQAPEAENRYLLVFAADTPIEARDIEDLVITESDVRSIAVVVGRKLFDIRGAQWSVTFLPW